MKRTLYWTAAAIGLVALIFVVDTAEDWLHDVSYPFNVWRMDLDDVAANIGLFLVGLAAFVTVFKKADKAHRKADQVSERVNGGLAVAAREHLQDNEVIHTMMHRMDRIEAQRDDCHDELALLRGRIEEL